MEPRIQYAKTSDGVSIAFWTLGKGMPFVHMPWFRMSHIQQEWQIPEYRRWYEALAGGMTLVRYDGRGVGLSDREVSDYSLEALVGDLEAVVDRLGLERFALLGLVHTGPVAIAYAARHPERVSHLLLWCTYARGADYARSSQVQATRGFMEQDWELYTETLAHVRLGWSEGKSARQFAAMMRDSITPEALRAHIAAFDGLDVTALLPQIKAPTFVLHRRRLPWLDVEVAQGLASRIPDAHLAIVEGDSAAPCLGDTDSVLRAIGQFLRLEAAPAGRRGAGRLVGSILEAVDAFEERDRSRRGQRRRRGSETAAVQTILFTDIEGSTALTQRLGDAGARAVLREHERIVREALRAHGGAEVKTMGDGFMASFGSAARALECAVAMQRALAERNADVGADGRAPLRERVLVRIGLNAGEPIAEEEDLFGTAVILAARIAEEAAGGEILVSDVVRQLAAGKGFLFAERGEVALRGFEEPARLYEVRWREEG